LGKSVKKMKDFFNFGLPSEFERVYFVCLEPFSGFVLMEAGKLENGPLEGLHHSV
jgi:hypothetical protein